MDRIRDKDRSNGLVWWTVEAALWCVLVSLIGLTILVGFS